MDKPFHCACLFIMTRRELLYVLQTRISQCRLAAYPAAKQRVLSLLLWALFFIAAGILHTMRAENDPPTPLRLAARPDVSLTEKRPDLGEAEKLALFVTEKITDKSRTSPGKWLTGNWDPADPALLDAPPTRLSLRLAGTLTGSEDRTIAIVAQNDQQQSVRTGELLSSTPARVIRIAEDRIVIETSGEYATVHFAPERPQGNLTK